MVNVSVEIVSLLKPPKEAVVPVEAVDDLDRDLVTALAAEAAVAETVAETVAEMANHPTGTLAAGAIDLIELRMP